MSDFYDPTKKQREASAYFYELAAIVTTTEVHLGIIKDQLVLIQDEETVRDQATVELLLKICALEILKTHIEKYDEDFVYDGIEIDRGKYSITRRY